MLADALRRMMGCRAAGSGQIPPEVLELERRAAVAMTPCTCGHMWHLHEHVHIRTGCDACSCERFRPALPLAPLAAAPRSHPTDAMVIRLRVAVWTHAWRDRRG